MKKPHLPFKGGFIFLPKFLLVLSAIFFFYFSNAQPVITYVSPGSAAAGSVVHITGNGFGVSTAASTVFFGTVPATVVTSAIDSIEVLVPTGTVYDYISVTVNNLTYTYPIPFITSFTPVRTPDDSSFIRKDIGIADRAAVITKAADIDGDGKPDILILDTMNNGQISVYRNIGGTSLFSNTPAYNYSFGHLPGTMDLMDIDGDGKPDIIATASANSYTNETFIFRNTSSAGIISFAAAPLMYFGSSGTGNCVLNDLNGDGKPDIIEIVKDSSLVNIQVNKSVPGNISFGYVLSIHTDTPTAIAVADMDNDGKPDIMIATNLDTIYFYKNTGSGTGFGFLKYQKYAFGGLIHSLKTADIDADGKPDLIIGSNITIGISVVRNKGSFTFDPPIILDGNGKSAAIGNLNGDDKPDLLINHPMDSIMNVFQNNSSPGTISFNNVHSYTASWPDQLVADFNNDGKPDIAAISQNQKLLTLYLMGASTTFLPQITSFTPQAGHTGQSVVISGKYFTGTSSVLFGNIPAKSFVVNSDAMITAIADSGATGYIKVTTPYGSDSSGTFTFLPAYFPQISSFTPAHGAQNDTVTIYGHYFINTSSVGFGGIAAASYWVISDSVIQAVVGIGASGYIRVTTTTGTDSIGGFQFDSPYIPPPPSPLIYSFSPSTGYTGTTVTISGQYFTAADSVRFGGTDAGSFTIINDSTIRAVVGEGASGEILVISAAGFGALNGFTYQQPPDLFDLKSFTAAVSNGQIIVQWQVLQDTGVAKYILGRGTDSSAGNFIDTVYGQSLDNNLHTYSFTDMHPATGMNYYRLFVHFSNGDSTVSYVVGASVSTIRNNAVNTYPNPSHGTVTVNIPSSANQSVVKIVDFSGTTVRTIAVPPNTSQVSFNTAGINPGVYRVYWTDGSNSSGQTILIE